MTTTYLPTTLGARPDSLSTLSGAVVLRRLCSADRSAVLCHLLRLSDQDRQMRFCQAFPDAAVAAYVAKMKFENDASFGLFDRDGCLIAIAETFDCDNGGNRIVEAAFSTNADWRHKGLATTLFHHVVEYARDKNIQRVIAQCLAVNYAMRALLRSVGLASKVGDGEVCGELILN
ncbi:MAG: GNAT family N-acetyltransferase [Ramlibacter sp.]|nr:GNAT family N-acetyltransferase [Ramlibacter sp.]